MYETWCSGDGSQNNNTQPSQGQALFDKITDSNSQNSFFYTKYKYIYYHNISI